jgi:hypothetical protein
MPKGACIHNTFLEFPDCGGLDSDQEECPFRRQQTDSALVRTYSSRVMLGQEDGRGVHPGRAEKPEPEPVLLPLILAFFRALIWLASLLGVGVSLSCLYLPSVRSFFERRS